MRREGKRSVSVRISLDWLLVGDGRAYYRWQALTIYTGRRCARTCLDAVPGEGPLVHPLV